MLSIHEKNDIKARLNSRFITIKQLRLTLGKLQNCVKNWCNKEYTSFYLPTNSPRPRILISLSLLLSITFSFFYFPLHVVSTCVTTWMLCLAANKMFCGKFDRATIFQAIHSIYTERKMTALSIRSQIYEILDLKNGPGKYCQFSSSQTLKI